MWKNILSISLFLCSVSLCINSLSPATAGVGPTTSFAINPLFSAGGNVSSTASFAIPAVIGQGIVVTDVTISAQPGNELQIVFTTSSGIELARYQAWNYSSYPGPASIDTHLLSGIPVPENEPLEITLNGYGTYTVSGNYAHP
jgi:hypothetical protein